MHNILRGVVLVPAVKRGEAQNVALTTERKRMRVSDQDFGGHSNCMHRASSTHAGTRCDRRLQEQVSNPVNGGCAYQLVQLQLVCRHRFKT